MYRILATGKDGRIILYTKTVINSNNIFVMSPPYKQNNIKQIGEANIYEMIMNSDEFTIEDIIPQYDTIEDLLKVAKEKIKNRTIPNDAEQVNFMINILQVGYIQMEDLNQKYKSALQKISEIVNNKNINMPTDNHGAYHHVNDKMYEISEIAQKALNE